MFDLEQTLKSILVSENAYLRMNEPMARHNTFRIGGPAGAFVSPGNEEELSAVLRLCRGRGLPYTVLGNGSCLLYTSDAADEL